jgi:UDP-N-acetylmuramoyl-L-alanyl-D-glutamate--2,6-diaminopimelate ligase
MDLKAVLEGVESIAIDQNRTVHIHGLALDSRKVVAGDLFLACRGSLIDGRDFIVEAVERGAVAVLCEDEFPDESLQLAIGVPIFVVPNLKQQLGIIAAKFYDYPAKKLTVIGVTGTNGKTTVTQYIAMVLNKLGTPCAIIGTLGVGIPGELNAAVNTTPDPITLQRLLDEFVTTGIRAVAMEVSSHGLAQGRLRGIDFTMGVFTNLTREHLDYHITMEAYGDAKKSLFTDYHIQHAILNGDDAFGLRLAEELYGKCDVCFYSISSSSSPAPYSSLPGLTGQSNESLPSLRGASRSERRGNPDHCQGWEEEWIATANKKRWPRDDGGGGMDYPIKSGNDGGELGNDEENIHGLPHLDSACSRISDIYPTYRAENIKLQPGKTIADLIVSYKNSAHEKLVLVSKILGRFNVSNLLAVIAVLDKMGVEIKAILSAIAELGAIDGRMEFYGGDGKKPLVVIDYAHTPDALEQALLTLQEYCHGSLWCVFGCGGDRDQGKRPMMGSIAERFSDHIVLTNDNPRCEQQCQIIEDILKGLLCLWAAEIEYDRATAIQYAINNAGSDDIILIAGKGHEDYQIIGEDCLPYSDKDVVMQAFADRVPSLK